MLNANNIIQKSHILIAMCVGGQKILQNNYYMVAVTNTQF